MHKHQQGESTPLSRTTRYVVLVPKYSHEGSGATRDHSEHDTQAAAEAVAVQLRATGFYRFVAVEALAPLTAQQETK